MTTPRAEMDHRSRPLRTSLLFAIALTAIAAAGNAQANKALLLIDHELGNLVDAEMYDFLRDDMGMADSDIYGVWNEFGAAIPPDYAPLNRWVVADAVEDLASAVGPHETVFVFYYGHGLYVESDIEYWFQSISPSGNYTDADFADDVEALADEAKNVTVLINSCFGRHAFESLGDCDNIQGISAVNDCFCGANVPWGFEPTPGCLAFYLNFIDAYQADEHATFEEAFEEIKCYGEETCEWDSSCWSRWYSCADHDTGLLLPDHDADGDGVENADDNCPGYANADQSDCDHDGTGNACDDEMCVDFCGDEVVDWVPNSSQFIIGGGTPYQIGVHYCTAGPGVGQEGEEPIEPWSDVQLRWCDCSEFVEPEGEIDLTNNCTVPDDGNCRMNRPQDDTVILFNHTRWHMSSWSPQTEPVKDAAVPQPDPPPGSDAYLPAINCYQDGIWSYWGEDEDSTGWTTYHCGPEWTQYRDPNTAFVDEKSTGWMWREELWWTDQVDGVSAPSDPPDKQAEGWGYLWIRPAEDNDGIFGRPLNEANNYRPFRLTPWSGSINPIMKKRLPRIFDDLPVVNLPDPVDAPMMKLDQPEIRDAMIGLYAVAPEAAPDLGDYAWPAGLAGDDAAIAGLVHVLVDGRSLEVRGFGYATGASISDVPGTVGFASARFGWPDSPDTPGDGDQGLAIFGGELASGARSDRLWIGRYGGLDAGDVPFFEWIDMTPATGPLPPARSAAVLVPDDGGRRLLLFGGTLGDGSVANDLWEYSFGRDTWSQLDDGFLALTDADAVLFRGRAYVAGGSSPDVPASSKIYRFDATSPFPQVVEIADTADGPGTREGAALGFAAVGAGRLLMYGGVDTLGVTYTDLWEYDLGSKAWSERLGDCIGSACPPAETGDFVIANNQGLSVGLYGTPRRGGQPLLQDIRGPRMGRKQSAPGASTCHGL